MSLPQSAQSGKDLYDLYRHFQGAYHSELETHQLTANQLADKKSELEASEVKMVKAKSGLTQAKADLEAATKKVAEYSLTVSNKDTEIKLLREQITEATDRERNAVVEYQKSMDFVSCLLNRYSGGWSAAMRCVKHLLELRLVQD